MPYKDPVKQASFRKAWREIRRTETQAIIVAAKNVPCMDCGVRYPTYVMDFDHAGIPIPIK